MFIKLFCMSVNYLLTSINIQLECDSYTVISVWFCRRFVSASSHSRHRYYPLEPFLVLIKILISA